MVTKTVVSAGGNWSASGTWSPVGAPSSSDDVVLNSSSGNLSINTSATCATFDTTGYTNTVSNGGSLTVAGNTFTLSSGMTYAATGAITFTSTSGSCAITTAGQAMPGLVFNGAGGTFQLQDSLTFSSGGITCTRGTLDTNSQSIDGGSLTHTGSNAFTLTLGSTTWTNASAIGASNPANFTLDAGTSTISVSKLNSNGLTWYDVEFPSDGTIVGDCTCNNLTVTGASVAGANLSIGGNLTVNDTLTINGDSTYRIWVHSDTTGTQRTIDADTVSITNTDFQDIVGAGAGDWDLSAILSGDCGNNSGIVFASPIDAYFYSTTGGTFTSGHWYSATGGGGSAVRNPLPQDTAIFNADSITSTGRTITINVQRLPIMNFTGLANSPTLAHSSSLVNQHMYLYGSVTLVSGLSLSGTFKWDWMGQGTLTFDSGGHTWPDDMTVESPGCLVQLASSFTSSGVVNVTAGTLDINSHTLTTTATAGMTISGAAVLIDTSLGGTLSSTTLTYTSSGDSEIGTLTLTKTLSQSSGYFHVLTAATMTTGASFTGGTFVYGPLPSGNSGGSYTFVS